MINTNELLSIGFALVSNFTNLVPVPPDSIPHTTNDLEKYVIGSPPILPLCLGLFDRRGAHFWVQFGVIQSYESPRSYFQMRPPVDIASYTGTTLLESNAVAALAASTLQRLAKGTNPCANVHPQVECPRLRVGGKEIPFYRFTWRLPSDTSAYGYAAQLEIDARSGEVTSLSLFDPAFLDPSFGAYIRNAVYRPEPTPKVARHLPSRDRFRIPTTNEVQTGIASWLRLCTKLDLNPGGDTNLSGIDWERSYVYAKSALSNAAVCQIYFTNGTCFECLGGVAIGHYSEDACYTGIWDDRPPDEWNRFRGIVSKKWQDLAKRLEERMVRELGVPRALLGSYRPALAYSLGETGTVGLVRCVVRWHEEEEDARLSGTGIEPFGALAAEFDVQSGQTKFVTINDRRLIEAVRGAAQ